MYQYISAIEILFVIKGVCVQKCALQYQDDAALGWGAGGLNKTLSVGPVRGKSSHEREGRSFCPPAGFSSHLLTLNLSKGRLRLGNWGHDIALSPGRRLG